LPVIQTIRSSIGITLKELKSLQPGDFVVHVDYGVGRFAGLEKVEVNGNFQEAIRLVFRDDDLLYINIHALHKISKYSGQEGTVPSMSKLGSPEWENKKKKVKSKVKDIAKELISLYSKRKNVSGYQYSKDSVLQVELESSFIYEDTPDQAMATSDVKDDMEKAYPMDRLVCGDVGFGKTEVAIRAAFKAVNDRKQVAILVPTTILAMQHFQTFKERLENFPVKVDYINRFRTAKEIKEITQQVTSGEIDILVGTHRIVNKDIKFRDLGLLIIDEEQKFGVKVKDQLKEMRVNVDVLTLTATPIPRTLHFSLMGARDLSVIATPPPNRQPITTEIYSFQEEIVRDAISYEIKRGGQVFFVHNRVGEIDSVSNLIMRLVPDARVIGAHGQMDGKKLEKIMVDFIEGEYDVLVSTNIIESGLDIPNANTIIINRAHMFGLSDLHQMRGRVGRSNKKAFCYLLTPPSSGLPTEARKRLQALEEFSDLGDGIKVAMRDLDIRGAGTKWLYHGPGI
jgi:transcription-repair coupling factor (superfamily II helicase)